MDEKLKTWPTIDEAATIAVELLKHSDAKEQAFFVAGFQECIKYMYTEKEE